MRQPPSAGFQDMHHYLPLGQSYLDITVNTRPCFRWEPQSPQHRYCLLMLRLPAEKPHEPEYNTPIALGLSQQCSLSSCRRKRAQFLLKIKIVPRPPPLPPAASAPLPTMPCPATASHVTRGPNMAAPSGRRPQPAGPGGGSAAGPGALRGAEEDAEGLYVAVERCPLCNTTRRRLTCAKCVQSGDFVFFDGRDSERYRRR